MYGTTGGDWGKEVLDSKVSIASVTTPKSKRNSATIEESNEDEDVPAARRTQHLESLIVEEGAGRCCPRVASGEHSMEPSSLSPRFSSMKNLEKYLPARLKDVKLEDFGIRKTATIS